MSDFQVFQRYGRFSWFYMFLFLRSFRYSSSPFGYSVCLFVASGLSDLVPGFVICNLCGIMAAFLVFFRVKSCCIES